MATKTDKKNKNVYRIVGNFKKMKKSQKFTKEVLVPNKQQAKEHILSILGSKYRLKRREITIENIEEIPADKVTDPIIKQLIGGK